MIDAYVLDKTVQEVSLEQLKKHLGKLLWIDCTNITKEEAATLKELFDLHALTAEDLVNKGTRVKVEEFSAHMFCVFYGLTKKAELTEIDVVLGKQFIITNHSQEIDSIQQLKQDTTKLEQILRRGCDFLFHRILDKEVDLIFVVLERLGEQVDVLEERAAERPTKKLLKKIYAVKRQLTAIRRTFLAQREKTGYLAKAELPFIAKKAVPYFRDVYDHSVRVHDEIESYREAIGNAYDVYMSSVSSNMNEVMKVLSIIATIALPLTVVSGIYGTNFTVLPGATFLHGFWAMILLMILMCIGMIYFFKKRKWV